jgi:hypothetical protein
MASTSPAGRSPRSWGARLLALLGFLLASLVLTPVALADPAFLRQGREQDALALFAPYTLGGPVLAGFALWDVAIQASRIDVTLQGPDNRRARLSLVHPEDRSAPADAPRTAHFRIVEGVENDPEGQAAARALGEAVRRNDQRSLWEAPALEPVPKEGAVGRATANFMNRWGRIDGVLLLLGLALLAALLAARILAGAPRWMTAALVGIVAAGLLLRLRFAPVSFLGAWPWSRLWPTISQVADGPGLAWITARTGPVALTDVIAWTHLAYAALMPLALFSHGAFLLRDPRVGLLAAFAVAFLPQHIRFSRAEDAFIPSLLLTSLAFAALHAWLRDPSRPVRIAALLSLPLLLALGYTLRPLNLLFVLVYLAAIAGLHPEHAPPRRRWIGALVVLAVALLSLPGYLAANEAPLRGVASDLSWILGIPRVLLQPSLLVLSDPRVTPPLLLLLAGAGVGRLRNTAERRVVAFLLGWLLLFLVFHAVVVQESMQPRYHMHLVVPFLLLASLAAVRWWEQARPEVRRWWASGAALMIALSPWIHRGFLVDLSRTEQQEHAFVVGAQRMVPEGCAVLEYSNDGLAANLRFRRIGERVGPSRSHRHRTIPLFAAGVISQDPTAPTLDELRSAPPPCLYLYEGLSCWSASSPEPCRALRSRLRVDEVERREVPMKLYDDASVHPARRQEPTVTFSLSRVKEILPGE